MQVTSIGRWALGFAPALLMGTVGLPSMPRNEPITRLKTEAIEPGLYRTEGYVVKVTTCPPCPRPGACAPCPPDSVVLSEDERYSGDENAKDELTLILVRPRSLAEGKRYRVTLEVKLVPMRVSRTRWRTYHLLDAEMIP